MHRKKKKGIIYMSNERAVWDFLKQKGLTDYATAGIWGNIKAESAFNPKNLQNAYEKKLNYTDEEYTEATDSGTYNNFIKDAAGYGLVQWTYWSRKQELYNYCKSNGKSVGDLKTQLEFMWKELQGYKGVMEILRRAKSIREASDAIMINYERPADQSERARKKRAEYGEEGYRKYAEHKGSANMGITREEVVDQARKWIGTNEADGSHRAIIDTYNAHTPLARGYKVRYTDAWCATFVSAVAIKCSCTNIIPTECSCPRMIELFAKAGMWIEDDAYKPLPGDVIFYDWDDNGQGDNRGVSDHVGIVEACAGGKITVIEGNYSNAVGRRVLNVNGKNIRGYGAPAYVGHKPNGTDQNQQHTANGVKVGQVVNFTGVTHYANANATSGSRCKPGRAKVTNVAKGKHPVHLVSTKEDGCTVYGWVNLEDIAGGNAADHNEQSNKGDYKVGDKVQFTGTTHYGSTNAAVGSRCKPGKAKITIIAKGKHPVHLVSTKEDGCTVYGWVNLEDIAGGNENIGNSENIHKVQPGDTLGVIARKYGTTVKAILEANTGKYPNITANYIVVGWELEV